MEKFSKRVSFNYEQPVYRRDKLMFLVKNHLTKTNVPDRVQMEEPICCIEIYSKCSP